MPHRTGEGAPRERTLPFLLWLALFYGFWGVLAIAGGRLRLALAHWPIAVAMAAGSFVAGSTPLGGGTVGFPILVLLFEQPARLGRDFSFAVQSVGMTSASIFILCRQRPIAWGMLRWALLGSLLGTPLCVALLAPFASDLLVKLVFAVLWASFGLMTLVKVREFGSYDAMLTLSRSQQRAWGLGVGLVGGALASLTGVGIDMLIFTCLVILARCDLKIAIPTSVLLMSFTSLVGLGSNALLASGALPGIDSRPYRIDPEVWANWLAAAPIVALGAPLGAFVVNRVPREPTLIFVALLLLGQFAWTCVETRLSGLGLAAASGSVLLCNALFHLLYSRTRSARSRSAAATRRISAV